jgi:2-dehydropantoate 2-reductase
MKIGIIGAGGVGGYYGAVLAAAGHDVHLLARGAHLDALRANGLEVRTPDQTFVARVAASDDGRDLDGAEFTLLAVKSYSLVEIAPVLRELAAHGTTVVPLMNGVGIEARLEELGIARARQLGGLTFISAARTAPGVVQRFSPFQRVVLGEFDGRTSERSSRLTDALCAAGVDARVSAHIVVEQWQKLIFIASIAAVCALSRTAIGAVRTAPHGTATIRRAIAEAAAVARVSGISIPDDEEQRVAAAIDALLPHLKPSLLVDMERGGPTEIDVLSGAISTAAARFGLDVPVHDAATAAVNAAFPH